MPSPKFAAEAVESIEEGIAYAERSRFSMPWDTQKLVFVVREPFQSRTSQTNLTAGYVSADNELVLESLMSENGIVFSDGIQNDFLNFNSGTILTIGVAKEKADLVVNQ